MSGDAKLAFQGECCDWMSWEVFNPDMGELQKARKELRVWLLTACILIEQAQDLLVVPPPTEKMGEVIWGEILQQCYSTLVIIQQTGPLTNQVTRNLVQNGLLFGIYNDRIRITFKPLLRIIFRLFVAQQWICYLLILFNFFLKKLLITHRTYSQFLTLDILTKHVQDFFLSIETCVLAAVKRGNTYKFVIDG